MQPGGASVDAARSEYEGDELLASRQRVVALTRELEVLRAEVAQHRGELTSVEQGLATLSGRTERHEAGQQLARDAARELETLRERLEAEAELRRELAKRFTLFVERGSTEEGTHEAAQEAVAARVLALEEQQQAGGERVRRLLEDLGVREAATVEVAERLLGAERGVDAEREAIRRSAEEIARLGPEIVRLSTAVDEVAIRLNVLASDQRRLGDDVAPLRASREHETELLEVVEQQRAARHRLETRLADLEERVAGEGARLDTEEERGALLRADLAGIVERLRALGEITEGQRQVMLEHARRSTRADEDTARRRAAELEREMRVARDLLTRLAEGTEQAAREQPL